MIGGVNDGIPVCYNTHAIGSVEFGLDGSLLITTGEGKIYQFVKSILSKDFDEHHFNHFPRFSLGF